MLIFRRWVLSCVAGLYLAAAPIAWGCAGCKTSLVSGDSEAEKSQHAVMAYSVSVLTMLGVVTGLVSLGAWGARQTLQRLQALKADMRGD
ncbi:MAG: hypothetical protein NZM04_03515 [Methylacidiphilales bacterium]|nr:hypothetical protein [Candidatus Methylacidiphilales bacterium]